jgi:hypothetical protein
MFQCSHYDKQFSSGEAVILLCLFQRLKVGYNPLLSVLYFGEHSSNSDDPGVSVYYVPLSWFRVR